MMSPVAYDHLSVPSRATSYSLPSCDPTSTDPSAAMAGDDTIGPPVAKVHQIAGLVAGSTNGERPRWVGPNRNIAWAGSIAYCGSGTRRSAQPARAATEGRGGVARPHAPASVAEPIELAVLVGRARARLHVRAAHARTRPTAARRRAATSVTVTVDQPVRTSHSGTRNERRANGAGAGRNAPGDGHGIRMAQG